MNEIINENVDNDQIEFPQIEERFAKDGFKGNKLLKMTIGTSWRHKEPHRPFLLVDSGCGKLTIWAIDKLKDVAAKLGIADLKDFEAISPNCSNTSDSH